MRPSSTPAAMPGTPSSQSRNASAPLPNAPGHRSSSNAVGITSQAEGGHYVVADDLARHAFETGRVGQAVEAECGDGGNRIAAEQQRGVQPDEAIDQPAAQQCSG